MSIVRVRRLTTGFIVTAALVVAAPGSASASVVYNVDTTKDGNLSNPSDTNCVAAVGSPQKCTLRGAVEATNNQPSGTNVTINVPAGRYKLTVANTAPANGTLPYGLFVQNPGSLDIVGAGAASTVVDANFKDRAFWIQNGGVTISGMTLENGRPGNLGHVTSCPATISYGSGPSGGAIFDQMGPLNLENDVITHNMAAPWGGGIYVPSNGVGAVTLLNTVVSHNTACTANSPGGLGGGGGIEFGSQDLLTIRHGVIVDNTAAQGTAYGGGISEDNIGGTNEIVDTTISGNHAAGNGGGIEADAGGTFHLFGDLLSGNTARGHGGGFDDDAEGTNTFVNTTVAHNTAADGGGIWSENGGTETVQFSTIVQNTGSSGTGNLSDTTPSGAGNGFTLDDSIVAKGTGASGSPSNCNGPTGFIDNGFNLFDDSGSECGSAVGKHDLINSDPKLGPLANNGGPTKTEALLPGSLAIDAASAGNCQSETKNAAGKTVDQRGFVPRPQGAGCDTGAFEATPDLAVTGSPNPNRIYVGHQDTVTQVITNVGPPLADNPTFTDPAAGSASYRIDSVSTSNGSCTHTAARVSCKLGKPIPYGGKVTVTIVLTGLTKGKIILHGSTATTGDDLDQRNNHDAVPIRVVPLPPPPPPPPPPAKPKISIARLSPACYAAHSTIQVTVKVNAPAGIREVTITLAGHTVRHRYPKQPKKALITVHVPASKLHPGRPYTMSAKVVDKLGRSDRAQQSFTVCKPPSKRGFTG